ncbi:hypothetical protein BRAS3843_1130010 [Bradyrhizobium sp. STM 3843]|uniref:hypothetical protein n=1 Tax=Bradyrhizobium sp. STM 3843 TaxID=551947 RepID=UPI00024066AF|nr:hypothetical protein [Bradyrhizobium sp. STM 3843]CCE04779.1 hypothetical protein BRAS3843_1130010 [Bradyrhizobium sp. STM 3843]
MPILQNQRWERFAINVFQSTKTRWSLAKCYREAGYRAVGHSSEMAASRLMKKDEVRMRIAELSKPVAKKAGLSLEALITRIEAAIAAAQADGAHGAVASNHSLILRIIELVEAGNADQVVFWGGAMTADEILQHIVDELGPDDAISIAEDIIAVARNRLADQATVIS